MRRSTSDGRWRAAWAIGLWALLSGCTPGEVSFSGPAGHASALERHVGEAKLLAQLVTDRLGVELPTVTLMPGDGAHAEGDGIFIGRDLAASLPTHGLAEILLHEAGHVYEGHTTWEGTLLEQLHDAGAITTDQYQDLQREQERVADVWAALGAWMFDPNPEWPAISEWFAGLDAPESDTHPDSMERALTVALLAEGLEEIGGSGFLDEPWFQSADELGPDEDEPLEPDDELDDDLDGDDAWDDGADDDAWAGDSDDDDGWFDGADDDAWDDDGSDDDGADDGSGDDGSDDGADDDGWDDGSDDGWDDGSDDGSGDDWDDGGDGGDGDDWSE